MPDSQTTILTAILLLLASPASAECFDGPPCTNTFSDFVILNELDPPAFDNVIELKPGTYCETYHPHKFTMMAGKESCGMDGIKITITKGPVYVRQN